MDNNQNVKKDCIIFDSQEEKLFKKYVEEYNELFEKILIYNPNDFIKLLSKRIDLIMKKKFNGLSGDKKSKIEDFIVEKIYCHEYKNALFAKKNISKRDKTSLESHIFQEEIIPHCDNDKKNGYYIHSCGENFQSFKYKPINYFSILSGDKKYISEDKYDYLLYCSKCDMIYKSDLIKFKCNSSNEQFYSRVLDKKGQENNNQIATWKKYHCNIIINDSMKCQSCQQNLFFLEDKNLLLCKNCNKELDPKTLVWKCIKCKSDFTAEAKIFNPLEYKVLKICIKETMINRKKARPPSLGCGCNYEIKKYDFFHKNSCKGKLYIGELNDNKIVVCEKCESLGRYNNYIWTCPKCLQRFKISSDKNEDNKNEDNDIRRIFSNPNLNVKDDIQNLDRFKSPIKNNNLFLQENNESKEAVPKTEIKNNCNIRRVNSAMKAFKKRKISSGLPTAVKEEKNINIIKKINESPTKRHKKCESKNLDNKIFSAKNNQNDKKQKRIMSNVDLSEIKNIKNVFKRYLISSPDKNVERRNDGIEIDNTNLKSNNNIQISNLNRIENIDNQQLMLKYKKSIVNTSSKVINQNYGKENNNNNNKRMKRCNSNLNDIKLHIIEPISSNKNVSKNIKITNENKIIKKNLFKYIKQTNNNKKEESTSCESENQKNSEENKISENKKIALNELNINDYKIKRQIGEGSFGQIFLIEDAKRKQFALKKIIATSSKDINSIRQEYQILLDIQNSEQKLNVVNIIGLQTYKLDITTHVLYVVMELASTDWEKEILKRKAFKKYYSEKELMQILSSLIKTLALLQSKNISHRDLKPQNILVFENNGNKIYKLADFGEAKEQIKDEKPTNKQTLRGTELYMSPILFHALRGRKVMKYIQHNPYKSDVFSFGLCSLFAATLCFESLYDIRELKSNVSLRIVIERYLSKRYSNDVIIFITKMLDVNETTRMDFIELEKELKVFGY